jgi:hypothetical protein
MIIKNNQEALEEAVSIVKEYVRGGGTGAPEVVLERVYKKIKELYADSFEK